MWAVLEIVDWKLLIRIVAEKCRKSMGSFCCQKSGNLDLNCFISLPRNDKIALLLQFISIIIKQNFMNKFE